jgi:hypothetical protein
MDLDFFTTGNPGLEGLQRVGDRHLKDDMIRLAKACPIENGDDLYTRLVEYYTGRLTVKDASEAVVALATGTEWASKQRPTKNFVEDVLRRSWAKLDTRWLIMLVASSHLAQHRATDEEVDQLFREVMTRDSGFLVCGTWHRRWMLMMVMVMVMMLRCR